MKVYCSRHSVSIQCAHRCYDDFDYQIVLFVFQIVLRYSARIMSRVRILIRFSLILLIVQSASCKWKPNNPKNEKETLCRSPDCTRRGKEYQDNMDADTHPCQDFYTFTCGNWHKKHPGPKYASQWSIIDVLNTNFASVMKNTIQEYNIKPGENSMPRQAKDVYDACVKIPQYPIKEAKPIANEIKRIGRYPTVSLWDMHTKYLRLTGESAFFSAKILASKPSEGIPLLMLVEPASAYGAIFHDLSWSVRQKQAYRDFLFRIMKSLDLKDSDSVINGRIEKVFAFRREFEKILNDNSIKRPGRFDPFTKNDLNNWFTEKIQRMTYNQKLPWKEIVDLYLKTLPAQTRDTRRVVAMRQKEYFLDLLHLLKKYSPEVLAYHVELYFVERHLKLQPDMFELLEETLPVPRSPFSDIREIFQSRWEQCIESHNMPETLEKMLFDKWVPTRNQSNIDEMIVNIKAAIDNQMGNSTWLSQHTREAVMMRLNQLVQWIGFPTWFTERAIPKKRSNKKDILTPNASLNIIKNLLYVHAPLMLPPLFSTSIPAVYNYAGIGTTLGHELYHMVHNCGSYPDGDMDIIWWSPETRHECLPKLDTFVTAFNKVTDREFKNRYKLNVKSDTSISLAENLPDVMGLEAAYNAYKVLVSQNASACATLPGFQDYSCDQMFYIAFGNTFCGYYTKESAESKLENALHSIDSVRINGGVAQMESFATAFHCEANTPMNPRKKVNLWK